VEHRRESATLQEPALRGGVIRRRPATTKAAPVMASARAAPMPAVVLALGAETEIPLSAAATSAGAGAGIETA
jgi:hypothetical protein